MSSDDMTAKAARWKTSLGAYLARTYSLTNGSIRRLFVLCKLDLVRLELSGVPVQRAAQLLLENALSRQECRLILTVSGFWDWRWDVGEALRRRGYGEDRLGLLALMTSNARLLEVAWINQVSHQCAASLLAAVLPVETT